MSNVKKSFFKRLFSSKNIIVLVAIVAAIFAIPNWGTTQLEKYLGITEQKIVLILLGLIALDGIIERVGLLENIESRLRSVAEKLPENTLTFRKRGQLPDLNDRIEATRELLLSGLTFGQIYNRGNELAQLLKEGCNIRILAVQPDSQAISYVANIDPNIASFPNPHKALAIRIDEHLQSIYRICSGEIYPKMGTIEIRTLDYVPPFVLFGVDCNVKSKSIGSLKVELLAHAPSSERPHVVLSDPDDQWYRFFLNQFERFWDQGGEWTPGV